MGKSNHFIYSFEKEYKTWASKIRTLNKKKIEKKKIFTYLQKGPYSKAAAAQEAAAGGAASCDESPRRNSTRGGGP